MKMMNKEECNSFVIPLPSWIMGSTPHMFLIPQHNQVKEGQKDQHIFNATEHQTMDSIPVNLMTSPKDGTELGCTFETVMTNFHEHLWNLWITFPNQDIVMHANDVKLCFWQLKHHPDIMGAFLFVFDTILIVHFGLIFGLNFSPAN